MEKLAQNIQEAFLNNARKDKTFLTIYLMSGVKLSGRIKSFDKYSVVLETNNQEQLIFKHAISTVVVSKPFHASAGGHSSGAARRMSARRCMERLRDHHRGDGVLKNKLLLIVGLQHDRILIETLDTAGKLYAAHQIDGQESLILARII